MYLIQVRLIILRKQPASQGKAYACSLSDL